MRDLDESPRSASAASPRRSEPAGAAEPIPEAPLLVARLRELERARRRRAFLRRFSVALPACAAGAAAAAIACDGALAAGFLRAAESPGAALRYAAVLAAAVLAAGLAARIGLASDRSLRRVAADADRGLDLADRAASAVDVLASAGARRAAGSMGALVVRDAWGRIPEGSGRVLYAGPPLLRPVLLALLASAASLAPFLLRHPSVARFLSDVGARSDSGAASKDAAAPPLVLVALRPDEGFSGSTVVAAVDGLGAGPVAVRFGSREAIASSVRGGEAEVVVPDDLPLGVVSVVVRQARRRSNALPFIVLPPPPGSGGSDPNELPDDAASERPDPDLAAAPPPPAGAGPDAGEKPSPREEPKKTIPRFVLPLESPDGERRVKEAFVLEPDPENRPATERLPGGDGPGPGGEGSPFRKAAEDAVRRPDLGERDREVVRRYFERLDSSAGGKRERR